MKAKRSKTGALHTARLNLDSIRTNAGTQTRARIDEMVVSDYAERMIAGDRFPPVTLFRDNGENFLADGFHRVHAARKARFKTIAADVRQGSRTDALKFSLQANHAHGLRRSSEDKRFATSLALREFPHLSDRAIADLVGVDHSSVASVRRGLADFASCDTRVGRDGKVRRLPSKPAAKANGEAVQAAADRRADDAVLKIEKSLTDIGTTIRRVVAVYPSKTAVLRGFVAKARSDLAALDSEMASFQPIHFISLGAGVQSSCMLLMAIRGEILPKPACAIFADVGNEPESVYRWIEAVLKPACVGHFPLIIASKGNLGEDASRPRLSKLTGKIYSKPSLPFYVKRDPIEPGGPPQIGRAPRQCTGDYKVEVVHRAIREFANLKKVGNEVLVHAWLGISVDEAHRMKDARLPWIRNCYPLIDQGMTRQDCQKWLVKNGYGKAPRSACTFCGFRSDAEWLRLKTQEPDAFADAVMWEKKFQAVSDRPNSSLVGRPFLHRSCLPIDQVKFKADSDEQSSWAGECEGLCNT
jgi:hypothetical protein